ncbi:MAG TPA: hypothetical protein VFN97_25765 [Actinospica sp.]|nr:hypothetical protein [Actinospica sp.]
MSATFVFVELFVVVLTPPFPAAGAAAPFCAAVEDPLDVLFPLHPASAPVPTIPSVANMIIPVVRATRLRILAIPGSPSHCRVFGAPWM